MPLHISWDTPADASNQASVTPKLGGRVHNLSQALQVGVYVEATLRLHWVVSCAVLARPSCELPELPCPHQRKLRTQFDH